MLKDMRVKGSKNDFFIEKDFEKIISGALNIPEAKFYKEGQNEAVPEPDLVFDKYLDAHPSVVRKRQTKMNEEKVAQRFQQIRSS